MILYLCLGLCLMAVGFAMILLAEHYDWSILSIILITPLLLTGFMLCICTTLRSNKYIEQASTVKKVTIEESGKKSLLMANGDIIPCQPDHQVCNQAEIGKLAVYRAKWHDSGLWVQSYEIILVTENPQ